MKIFKIKVIIIFFIGFSLVNCKDEKTEPQPNVLFIAVDDMADWAGYLGHPDVITPNIDKLASRGIAFTAAQCSSPICGPSRAGIMTGMRAETTKVYSNVGNYSDYIPEAISLPEYFRLNGYYTMGAGKLIHPYNNVIPKAFDEFGPGVGIVGTPFTDAELSVKNFDPTYTVERLNITLPLNVISNMDRPENRWSTFDWGPLDITDDEMPDGQIANWAVAALQKKFDKPFFIGAGFYKPHQPLFAPRKYFDMYDVDKISLPPTIEFDLDDVSDVSKTYALGTSTGGKHSTVVEYNQWRNGVLGYLATITFVDAQIGKLLDALDSSPYADNTLIVFWSDHGWHLGEKEHWGKQSVWERSTQVPMIIIPPKNQKITGGQFRDAPVNLLDVYPTLVDLCGLPDNTMLEGRSLKPLLDNPNEEWKYPSVTTMGRETHSVRTEKWRYIQYFDGSEELYEIQKDPNEFENLSSFEEYDSVKEDLVNYLVNDLDIKRTARLGTWKIVEENNGKILLFDLNTPQGLTETQDVAEDNPELINKVKVLLGDYEGSETRFVLMDQ